MSTADVVLQRLDHVRKTGPSRWSACCPSHQSKSKASLAIQEGDDGKVLLHCFGGCDIEAVVGAIGLQVKDLFPDKSAQPGAGTPAQKLKLPASQALQILAFEASVIAVIGSDMARHKAVSTTDHQRLLKAVGRVQMIAEATR